MAEVLNDKELKRIVGGIIVDGDPTSVQPNSYVLRLRRDGEFLNTGKSFKLGNGPRDLKGIRIAPVQSVGITSRERIDFSRATVDEFFADNDLHGFLTPTTRLSREGLGASSTQIDAGCKGTLNRTITNSSHQERRFLYEEPCYRLTILKLNKGERPSSPYEGDYQEKEGYVPSKRRGAPTGMKERDWAHATLEGGPEEHLQALIKTGYPWDILGERLILLDGQLKTVSDEYASIRESMDELRKRIDDIAENQSNLRETVRNGLREEMPSILDRVMPRGLAALMVLVGLGTVLLGSPVIVDWWTQSAVWLGAILVLAGAVGSWALRRRKWAGRDPSTRS